MQKGKIGQCCRQCYDGQNSRPEHCGCLCHENIKADDKLACKWCGCALGSIEKQHHDNPDFAEFRTCVKCGYQWAKRYWKECEVEA